MTNIKNELRNVVKQMWGLYPLVDTDKYHKLEDKYNELKALLEESNLNA